MKPREFLHDTLDIDHGLLKTFLTLFTDPARVVLHPEHYTKPWKYATYVVSISCLLTWFLIHWMVDPVEQSVFWDVPKRVNELSAGFANFYENTQPLKRLLIHSIGLWGALLLVFYKLRKSIPLPAVSLLIIGHSVFLQFIFQSLGIVIFRQGMLTEGNVMPYIGVGTHIAYLLYALIRIYHEKWTRQLLIPLVIAIEMVFYGFTSTRLQHMVYYSALNHNKRLFHLEKSAVPGIQETPAMTLASNVANNDEEFVNPGLADSIRKNFAPGHLISQIAIAGGKLLILDCYRPAGEEIAKIFAKSYSLREFLEGWSVPIFEKMNRYSPAPEETFMIHDPLEQTVFAGYRISNDSNATIRIVSIKLPSGNMNFSIDVDSKSDDIHVFDAAMDSSNLYVCGSAQDIFGKYELGFILKVGKTGAWSIRYLGDDAFTSVTRFRRMNLIPGKIEILAEHEYKRLFVFRTTGKSLLTIPRESL